MTGEDVVCRSFTAPYCITPAHDGKYRHKHLALQKMRSIVVWLSLLSVLVAVTSIAVDGDLNCKVATLVATLETTLEQLKSETKNCCQSDTTADNFVVIFFLSHSYLHLNVCCFIFFLGRSVIFLVQGSL